MTGKRGELYVVIQGLLFALVLFGPVSTPAVPVWGLGAPFALRAVSVLLIITGLAVSLIAAIGLGKSLTPLPFPRDEAQLVTTGIYRLVRHPIYFGVILTAIGWSLWCESSLTLLYTAMLALFFDIKSRREELWLCQKFADYPRYQNRTKKLIPLIY